MSWYWVAMSEDLTLYEINTLTVPLALCSTQTILFEMVYGQNGDKSKRRQVKTATGQNGDTETATEMAIFKTATNPNNTYSSSEAYIIDCRLYTYMACNC